MTAKQGVELLSRIRTFVEREIECRAPHQVHACNLPVHASLPMHAISSRARSRSPRPQEKLIKVRNLRQIDAAGLLKTLRWLKLPFEYLVRSTTFP